MNIIRRSNVISAWIERAKSVNRLYLTMAISRRTIRSQSFTEAYHSSHREM